MSRRQSAVLPADALENWLFAEALPYWAGHGYDRDCGGFHERLDDDRRPVVSDGKRAMVQCRQIYAFAQAALLDRVRDAADLARAGHDFLVAHCRHPDGGWRFRVARDGRPMDDTRDLYTHAFVLFALAWRYRLDRTEAARALADETMRFLDRSMAHPAGGYHEGIDPAGRPTAGPRRQNPHMHLFEALLEWHAATGDMAWLRRATPVVELLAARFCVEGTLREYFTGDLSPAPGDEGRLVEPGHHYEWSWLLHRYQQCSGDARHAALAGTLYDFAETHGIDSANSGVIDAVDCAGKPMRRSRRCWPQTEAVKAHIARFEATGDPAIKIRIQNQADSFFRSHIAGAPTGAWREHLGEDGKPLVSALPASSLYHITLAAAELGRLRRGG
jgi:mannose/cellobiose epimerase-like protein (N-acyl-D-glucosamine 2-epimerase family)